MAKILVVEDSPVNQKVIAHIVESMNLQCDIVSTGLQAIRTINQSYAAVLIDLRTPDMDGFTASRAIRNMGNSIPIIAYSATPRADDWQKCMAAGINEFLQKPASLAQLHKSIGRWIGTTTCGLACTSQWRPQKQATY